MKKSFVFILFIELGFQSISYCAFQKLDEVSEASNKVRLRAGLTPDLQNLIMEFCYGRLNPVEIKTIIKKIDTNETLTPDDLTFINNIFGGNNGALELFDTYNTAEEETYYTTHPNIKLLKELYSRLTKTSKKVLGVFNKGQQFYKELLFLACGYHKQETVNDLIRKNVDINAISSFKATPLYAAICWGHNDIARQLINNGANPDTPKMPEKITPLHCAVCRNNIEGTQLLLNAMAKTKNKDVDGNTPLHIAASFGNAEIVDMLIKARADITAQNNRKETPLHMAARTGKIDAAKILITAGAKIDEQDMNNVTPLHMAAFYKHHEMVKLLLACNANIHAKTKLKYTALHWAALSNQAAIILTLLATGANPDARACDGATPLDYAVNFGGPEAVQVLSTNLVPVIQQFGNTHLH